VDGPAAARATVRQFADQGVDDLAHMVVEPLPSSMARDLIARGIAWVPTLELWKGVTLGTDSNGCAIPFDMGFPITEARLLLEAGLRRWRSSRRGRETRPWSREGSPRRGPWSRARSRTSWSFATTP